MADALISEKFVVDLLALPSFAEQSERLVAVHLANEDGLDDLLTYAEVAVRHDPMQARGVAQLCEEVATLISIPALVPRATYLRAQTFVLRGDAQTALTLIETAHDQFLALGRTTDALRTDVGAMTALTTLGRYRDALERGTAALAQARSVEASTVPESLTDLALVRAKIHVNQGPAFSETGRFDEALTAYTEAEAIYASLQMADDQVLVLSNRGVALRYLGRVDEALEAYQRAASLLPGSGYLYALMQNNIGDAHLLLGDYQASLAALSEARREFAAQDAAVDSQICASHMADAYLALNLYPEALTLYQASAESLEETDYRYYLGKALWGIGSAHGALSEPDKSSNALARAVEIFTQLDNTPIAAQIMLEQSALHEAQGEHAVALLTAQQALDSLDSSQEKASWPVQQVYAHLRLADLLLPNDEAAEGHLQHVETLLQGLSIPHLRYRFLQRLGQVRRLQDRDDEAQQAFEGAIAEIERMRSSLADEAMLVSFQQDKMAAYEGLIRIFLDRLAADQYDEDAARQTFDLIERAKSRALVERISGVVQAEAAEGLDPETAAQLQQIQRRLSAIYNDMLGQEDDAPEDLKSPGDRSVRMAQLSRQADKLEQELTQVRLRLATHARRIESFEQSMPLTQIQAELPPDLTIISYHVAGEEILAFVFTRDAVHTVRQISRPSAVEEALRLLASLWNHLGVGGAFIERHIDRLEKNAQQPLQQLYHALLTPLEQMLDLDADGMAQKLVIIPHGLLHQVPFQALHDGDRYLIEKAEISYAPSATVLALCRQRQPSQSKRLLVLGVSDPAIPAVETEVRVIEQLFPQSDVFLNEEATVDALSENVSGCRVLHLACHGLFRTDNPMFSALKLHNGWLTAAESAQMDLSGALVVLSACESGRGTVLAGDETIGLTRAFLGAGAATLAVSQWLVQDDTGAMLMAEWYTRLARGQHPASALRSAQLTLKSSHPHPYYWAPFVLIGDSATFF